MAQYFFTGATALNADDDQVALSGQVYMRRLNLTNPDAATVFIKFRNAATYDVSAEAPTFEISIAAGGFVSLDMDNLPFGAGLCMASTDTQGTGGSAPTAATIGVLTYDVA